MFWGAGDCVPAATLNVGGADGVTTSKAELETTNVTGITSGLLMVATPVEVMVAATEMDPVQVPARSPAGFTEMENWASVEPEMGTVLPLRTSQLVPVQVVSEGVAVKVRGA